MAEDPRVQLDADVDGLDEGSDGPQNTSNLTIRRACDACRTRKIRCDRNSPCSHCVHAKIPCTHQETRPKEKRTRILLSAQYEKKIDIIDRRLEALTQLMRDMKMNMTSANLQSTQNFTPNSEAARQSPAQASSSTPYGHLTKLDADSPVVEGESSLAAHGEFANEFLKNAVGTESLQGASLELRETLDSLHHIVNSLKQQTAATEMSYPYARPAPRPTLRNHELPPIQLSVSIIRECETENSEISAWIREFFSLENFSGMCLHVYFSEDVAEADFILVNVGLMYMFMDRQQRSKSKQEQDDCEEHCKKLRQNAETALANLPFHLPATSNMISALLLGAFYAIEISKPSLAWTLSSKASELCQTLGYHRISTMKNDKPLDAQKKKFLFWNVYYIDKSLSLRLGRASTIQDWDVTVPLPSPESTDSTPLSAFISLWVATARCQGHIYELLYSPGSMNQPDDTRRYRAQKLVADLDDIARRGQELSRSREKEVKTKLGEDFFDFILISDDVLRLSLRTLIYRATPAPPNFRDCMDLLGRDNTMYFPSYVSWTLLFAPFIPFIVVFCQVIETQDQTDLARLHSFCTSLDTTIPLSDAAAKTHRLFQVLYTVALRYIEFRTTTPPPDQTQASVELNNYLTALGFPPAGLGIGGQQASQMNPDQNSAFSQQLGDVGMPDDAEGQRGANTMMWMGNTAQLGEWFNSNQQMMELLEEPSFTFPQQQ
ncbi:C6 transcription factor [Fusarium heterosporum]|uniref:C6 transcription factor n=1 Tax=Fusarium heterosporum TaxID=42747 RepID=A0A8H5SWK0_FUSHE|nr:C6 transcription factor [Fusarium heterosporum]